MVLQVSSLHGSVIVALTWWQWWRIQGTFARLLPPELAHVFCNLFRDTWNSPCRFERRLWPTCITKFEKNTAKQAAECCKKSSIHSQGSRRTPAGALPSRNRLQRAWKLFLLLLRNQRHSVPRDHSTDYCGTETRSPTTTFLELNLPWGAHFAACRKQRQAKSGVEQCAGRAPVCIGRHP